MSTNSGRSLAGRVAMITGVSRKAGIGYAIAHRLAQQGAHLFLHGLAAYDSMMAWGADSGGIASIAEDVREYGNKVAYVSADLSDPDAPSRLMGTAIVEYGNVDILVINHAYSMTGTLEELTADSIDMHLQVNVRGSLLLIKEFAANFKGIDGGRVIMMTSGQHLHPMTNELAYAVSKGAIHQMTAQLAAHLAPRKITVNTVNPGATDTGYANRRLYEEVLAQQPMGRWGVPDDAARLIAWLASDSAQWITGQVINSTGGGV